MNAIDATRRQFRLAARSLLRRPVLAVVGLLTLALGIGANTAIFSIINVVLLKPLPFADPNRLTAVMTTSSNRGIAEGFSSYPDFKDWRDQSKSFAGLAAFWMFPNGDVNLAGGSEPQRVAVARVTPGFFELLGVRPLYGRTFQAEESIVGNHRRAILSYGLWHQQFGADTSLIGKTVQVNSVPYTVVGIMPPELEARSVHVLGTDVQLWRPLVPDDNQTGGRGSRKLRVVGRLAPGVSISQAQSELSAIATHLAQTFPETNRDDGVRLVPVRDEVVRDVRRGLIFLLAAVAVVLIGACANVANLLLIKAAAGRKQLAVQYALGASRTRLVAQVLLEGLLLGVAGAVLGIAFAYWAVKAFVALGPADIPLLADARIDATVLGFTIASTMLTVILVSVFPAWRSSQPDATGVLRQSASRVRNRDDRRLMRILSTSQIALAMLLLTTGGLLVRGFASLVRNDPGFDRANVLTLQLELPMAATAAYPHQPERDVFFGTLLQKIAGVSEVRSVTLANAPPLEEDPSPFAFRLPGEDDSRSRQADFRLVAADYFGLLRIPVLKGRGFDVTDSRSSPPVVVVSDALAQSVWPGENAVGKQIEMSTGNRTEVVGVVGNVRAAGLNAEFARTVYVPTTQGSFNFMTVLIKTKNEPTAVASTIRRLVRELDPTLPLHHVRTLDAIVSGSVAQQRFQVFLISAFSFLMLALAVVGIYGVTAYAVSERTNELGIRAALGATASDIRGMVLRDGIRLAGIGIVIGAVGAAAVSGVLTRFVFQIGAIDYIAFVAAPIVLGGAAMLATWIPAHRAAQIDPMRALRAD